MRWARPSARRHPEQTDAGFTLLELIIAILLVTTAIAALLTAWSQNLRASVKHRDQSETQTKVVTAVNWIASNDISFVSCRNQPSTPSESVRLAYQGELETLAYGGAFGEEQWQPELISIVKPVEFWNPATEQWVTATTPEECPSPVSPLQRVTVRVEHPSGSISTEIEVVKSDVWSQ